jgi:hypothetical protein
MDLCLPVTRALQRPFEQRSMCNDFGNRIPYYDYLRAFSQIRVPLKWPPDPAPVVRRRHDGVELVQPARCRRGARGWAPPRLR